jgi:hypothetical protein
MQKIIKKSTITALLKNKKNNKKSPKVSLPGTVPGERR